MLALRALRRDTPREATLILLSGLRFRPAPSAESGAQRRVSAAVPQALDGDQEQERAAREHQRRLSELESGAAQGARLRRLPSAAAVAERLRSSAGASCSGRFGQHTQRQQQPKQQQQQQMANSHGDAQPLDWRAVVRSAREALLAVSDEQMLTDTFGRRHSYLRISLTERCNLRCLYCMPEAGVELTPAAHLLTNEEVLRLARLFVGAGVDKVRLTGGEPTLRRDLPALLSALRALPGLRALGLTTNGLTLEPRLRELQAAGLTHLNISLDTLRPERFEAMTRRRGHNRVLRSIHLAAELGFDPVKVNVVVMRGVNDDELLDFVEMTRGLPVNVRFIEYMPFDGNVWTSSKLLPYAEMLRIIIGHYGEGALQRCADPAGEVAKNFTLPGFRGSVSFVTSMTKAFCGDCNRLRLMADGALKVCLFGANEVSLRDAMRDGASDEDLRAVVSAAVDRKRAAHAGMAELARSPNRAMVRIGG